MKQIFSKFFLVALLSVLGVSNAFAADVYVYADPQYQSIIGDLDMVKFDYYYANGTVCREKPKFGKWSGTVDHMGETFGARYFLIKLALPAAGTYGVVFQTRCGVSNGDYQATIKSITDDAQCTITADAHDNGHMYIDNIGWGTGGSAEDKSDHFFDYHYIKLVVNKPCSVDVKVCNNYSEPEKGDKVNNMDAKFFKLVNVFMDASSDYQGLGILDISKFGYRKEATDLQLMNFGCWATNQVTESNFIGNFRAQRSIDIKLQIPAAGKYRLLFKSASESGTSEYGVSSSTGFISNIKADGTNSNTITVQASGNDQKFSQGNYVDFDASQAGEAIITITHTSGQVGANMREFELADFIYATPEYQGVGDLEINKFAYSTDADLRFGKWVNPVDFMGYTMSNRYFTMKLALPAAGTYGVTYVARSGENNNRYRASVESSTAGTPTLTADGSNDAYIYFDKVGWGIADLSDSSDRFLDRRYLKIEVAQPCSVDIKVQHESGNMDARDFKLVSNLKEASIQTQELGKLDIDKFGYKNGNSDIKLLDFGCWATTQITDANCIDNFRAGRSIILKLQIASAGKYRVKFKIARLFIDLLGEGRYTATVSSGYTITADGHNDGTFTTKGTGGWDNFDEEHFLIIDAPNAGEVNVEIKHNTSPSSGAVIAGWAKMKNFEFQLGRNIVLDANEGVCAKSSFYLYDPVYGEINIIPARSGYIFKGWYSAKSGGEKIIPTTPYQYDTLYAQWEEDSNYKQVKDSSALIWNDKYTFTNAITAKDIKATWVSEDPNYNGKICEECGPSIAAGQTVLMKFAQAYKGADSKYYDIYAAVTVNVAVSGKWEVVRTEESGDGARAIGILKNKNDQYYAMDIEFFLQDGDQNATDVEFIAGSSSVDENEYAIVYGDQLLINSNMKKNKYSFEAVENNPSLSGWKGTTIGEVEPNKYSCYILGTGYTANHHVRVSYATKKGTENKPEFTIGYLKCQYTFQPVSGADIIKECIMNENLQPTKHADAKVNTPKGWRVIGAPVSLLNDSVIPTNGIITVNVRDSIKVTCNDTLKAYSPFYITFDKVRSEATLSTTFKQVEMGDYYGTLPEPTCTGYNFVGWFTEETAGTQKTATDFVLDSLTHTLYAHWTGKTITVTYQVNGGDALDPATKDVTFASAYGELATPTRAGYTFDGWFTQQTGGDKVEATTTVTNLEDHDIWAHWTAKKLVVTFNVNGGTALEKDTMHVTFNQQYGTLPTPTYAGYDFDGWFDAETGGNKVEATTTVTNPENHTLWAHWTANTLVVTFKVNGGTALTKDTMHVTFNAAYGTLPSTTREKYNFQGWFTDSIGGTVVTSTTTVTNPENHTLWAHWLAEEVGDGTGEKDVKKAETAVKNKLQAWKEECDSTKAINLTIVRTIYKDGYYNTLCLPFDLSAAQIEETFGTYKDLQEFKSATVTGEEPNRTITIELEPATTITSGKAYLISFNEGDDLTQLDFKDVIVLDTAALKAEKSGNMAYQGILAPFHLTDNDKDLLFLGENNKLYWPNDDGTFMKGFRAYFKVTTTSQSPSSPYKRGMKAAFGDKKTPTDIVNENVNENENEIRKLVEQGRVVIITNGKKYDLQGNPL